MGVQAQAEDRGAGMAEGSGRGGSDRDPRYAGFAEEPTQEQVRRVRELYRLLDVPDDEIDRVFSGVAIRDELSFPDEDGIPADGANPGAALYDLCFTMWACEFDWKETFDEVVWSYEKMLELHEMWETLDATDSAEVHAARFAESPAEETLRYLLDLQCDEDKRALLLDDGSDALHAVVVGARDLDRMRRDMGELFGPDWSILYEGGGPAKLPPEPLEDDVEAGERSVPGAVTYAEALAGTAPASASAEGASGSAAPRPHSDEAFPFVTDARGRTASEQARDRARGREVGQRAGRLAGRLGKRLVRALICALVGAAIAVAFSTTMDLLGVKKQERTDWQASACTARQQAQEMEQMNRRTQEYLESAQTMEFGKLPTTSG